MTASSKVVEFDGLVKALNKIIFGSEIETVTLNGIVKPTISNFLKSYTLSKADVLYVDAEIANIDAEIANVAADIAAYVSGRKAYRTLAEAQAAQSSLSANTAIEVTNDGTNNGIYQWDGTTLTKSLYDPLTQAKQYSDQSTEHQYSEKLFSWVDANNIPVMFIDSLGRLWLKDAAKDIASFVAEIRGSISTTEGNNILVIKDANGVPVFRITSEGEALLPKIGSIPEYVKSQIISATEQVYDSISPSAYRDSVYSSALDTDHLLTHGLEKFEKQKILITAAQLNESGVFNHIVTKVRIPAITRIQKNVYLCFFEAREADDDFGRNSQGVITITVDPITFDATYSNIKALHLAEPKEGTNGYYTFMNACAVKLDSGRIIALYVKRYGSYEHYIYKRYSDDDGATWSQFEDIGSAYLNMAFYNLLCPCSQGMVKRYGSNKGRIVFPVWYSTTSYTLPSFRAGYIYSDDGGDTWHDGGFILDLAFGNEVQCCEDITGDIIFNVRLEVGAMGGGSTDPNVRLNKFAILKDGTLDNFTILDTPKLSDNSVMSGLIQGRNKFDGRSAKIQFVIAKTFRRQNMTIYTSYDACKTWLEYNLPNTTGFNNIAAYSCIESLSIDKNFILWEADSSNHLATSIVSLKNLIGD